MSLFFSLVFKIFPLYLNIVLGYIANRFLSISREAIAGLMFYLFSSLIMFYGILTIELKPSLFALPLIVLGFSTAISILFGKWAKKIWSDRTQDLAAFAAGSGNYGYFGLPLALLLLDPQAESIYILAIFGGALYDNTVGYYTLAKENHPIHVSLMKLLKLPTLHAFIIGLLLNLLGFSSNTFIDEFMVPIKGTYSVLGMMIIGLGISGLTSFKLDFSFIRMTLIAKFLAFPLFFLAFIALDQWVFHFYNQDVYQALMLISIVPLGVNTAILASLLNVEPEKASAAVVISTLVALFYVPIFTAIML